MARFPRLQNLLLVLIAVLLLLNILLPTRNTVQMVQMRGLEAETTASLQPSKPSVRPREETGSKESTDPVTTSTESDAGVRVERARAPPWSRKDISEEEFQRRRREEDLWPGEHEAGVDYRESIREREDMERSRINLHDPAQRLTYYKKLRRRMMEGGPDIRAMRERRSNGRLEMVREMWDGWFEDSQECKWWLLQLYNVHQMCLLSEFENINVVFVFNFAQRCNWGNLQSMSRMIYLRRPSSQSWDSVPRLLV